MDRGTRPVTNFERRRLKCDVESLCDPASEFCWSALTTHLHMGFPAVRVTSDSPVETDGQGEQSLRIVEIDCQGEQSLRIGKC